MVFGSNPEQAVQAVRFFRQFLDCQTLAILQFGYEASQN